MNSSYLAIAAVTAPLIWILGLVTWHIATHRCPGCRSRSLNVVGAMKADGPTRAGCGSFRFYRCNSCGATLQRRNASRITVATHWPTFIDAQETRDTNTREIQRDS